MRRDHRDPEHPGFHGIFSDKRDPVDKAINHTTRVFCGNEFHIPQPNDGRDLDDPTKYFCLFTCVDAETMEVRWQCKVDGNMDLVATPMTAASPPPTSTTPRAARATKT